MPDGRLIQPPRLRQSVQDEERRATWLELFFDLVFVVVVAQLAGMSTTTLHSKAS